MPKTFYQRAISELDETCDRLKTVHLEDIKALKIMADFISPSKDTAICLGEDSPRRRAGKGDYQFLVIKEDGLTVLSLEEMALYLNELREDEPQLQVREKATKHRGFSID